MAFISRRRRALGTLALLAAAGCGGTRPAPPPPRPNIVLLVLDTVRADHLPLYGYPRDTAPFLTSLGGRSVVFDRAYSTSGWTSPSMASMFTSVHPFQHGVIWGLRRMREGQYRFNKLPTTLESLPEALKKAGYATFAVSDNINISPLTGFDRGFDRFESASDASAEAVGKRVKKWKAEILSRQPYFLYIQYMDAHAPYQPKAPWFDEFLSDTLPAEVRRDTVSAYDSEIRYIDTKMRGLAEALGWGSNTLLIVTADHGEEFADHGLGGHAHSLYQELLRVPLVVSWPEGGLAARRLTTPVNHLDLLPTLRAVAGLPPDPRNVGDSLLPLLREGRWGADERTLLAHLVPLGTDTVVRGAVRGRWKHVWSSTGDEELFDLLADPLEKTNRMRTDAAVARELRAQYAVVEEKAPKYAGVSVEQSLDPESQERLRALGYVK